MPPSDPSGRSIEKRALEYASAGVLGLSGAVLNAGGIEATVALLATTSYAVPLGSLGTVALLYVVEFTENGRHVDNRLRESLPVRLAVLVSSGIVVVSIVAAVEIPGRFVIGLLIAASAALILSSILLYLSR